MASLKERILGLHDDDLNLEDHSIYLFGIAFSKHTLPVVDVVFQPNSNMSFH